MSVINVAEPFRSHAEFHFYQKIYKILSQVNKLGQSAWAQCNQYITRLLSFLTSPEMSEADLDRLLDESDKIDTFGIGNVTSSIHPLLYALQFCLADAETNYGKMWYFMENMVYTNDFSLVPNRTLLHRAMSKCPADVAALIKGNFVSKKFVETLFGAEKNSAGDHGMLSRVAIGEFDLIQEQYVKCVGAMWRNCHASTTFIAQKEAEYISKFRFEFGAVESTTSPDWLKIGHNLVKTMSEILIFIKHLPKVDPVAKDGIKVEVLSKIQQRRRFL